MSEPHSAAPGWYPDPQGKQHYWDGTQWLSLPEPPGPEPDQRKRLSRGMIGCIAACCAILALTAVAVLKVNHDTDVDAKAAAAETARQSAERRAAEVADRERKEEAERSMRQASVHQVEASIMEMATGHANSSIIDGPILSVSCSPVAGGSVDDLLAATTVLECFAATQENPNGSRSGYKYHATMNWETGSYTYGFGAP
ncbi:DUF2510 domain-containing protein [Rhodococcus sp. O3]|uniref:DUF2510 domain-containing protein n=1 Tax=Rhodococcus sp. O3 TaxID=3404919 RepID=UPI003B67268B